jgi:ATP-binding cassette subfamily B protein
MKKVLEVSEKLGMTKFIETLPNGYSTYLGENGATLSGGQKQRIAIARALYRDPEIIVLDEATSSMDSISETFVQNAMKLLKEDNKTIIIIAHRLSTISLADRIIVLDKGNVVQAGSFGELALINGHFRNMWVHQNIESIEILKS